MLSMTGDSIVWIDRRDMGQRPDRKMKLLGGSFTKPALFFFLISCITLISGCAIHPEAIKPDEHFDRAQGDLAKMYGDQEPATGPIDLADALARAVRYNMGYRLRLMEQASAMGQLDLGNLELLPRMTVSAGYSNRNNDAFGYGFTSDGKISDNPSASSERSVRTNKAAFSWNILDFGLSYFLAKQMADEALVAQERQRKALQNLVLDVRQAFWRAHAAQELLPEFERLMADLNRYAARVKIILDERLLPPAQAITLRRSLVEFEQQLAVRASELTQARFEFANLLNLPQSEPFTLTNSSTKGLLSVGGRRFTGSIDSLDMLALELRPELREEGYRMRQSELAKSRAKLQAVIPGLSIDISRQTNSNRYLVNDIWTQIGADAAVNMVKLFSLPVIDRAAEAQKQVNEARRMALAASVLAQIRIAVTRFDFLLREYEHATVALDDDARLLKSLESAVVSGVESDFEVLKAKARLFNSKINVGLTYASLEGAMARIHNSVGLDFLPAETDVMDLADLTQLLVDQVKEWEETNFRTPNKAPVQVVSVRFASKVEPVARSEILKIVSTTMKHGEILVAENGDYQLYIDIDLQRSASGRVNALITGKLMGKAGKLVDEFKQRSALTDPITARQWAALGQGVAINASEAIKKESHLASGSTKQ